MFNVFVSLPVIVCALQILRTCVCDVWDDGDQQSMLDNIFPELYEKYRYAMGGSAEATFTYRRAFNNKEYMIHINRLKAVNGHKKHNLIIKEKSNDNPLIYINNPVETKVPNAYLSLEEFKELLIGRALRQRNEFQQKYKTKSTSKSSLNKPKRVQYTKKDTKQTKPNKYVAPITTNTNKIPKKTTKSARAKDISKTKVPRTILLSNNLKHTDTTQLKTSEPVTNPNTLLVDAIGKTSKNKFTLIFRSAGENKTEETISQKSTTEESFIKIPISYKSTDEELTHITTTEKSSTEEVINKKSITEEPISVKVSKEKFAIVKHGTDALSKITVDNPIIHDILEVTTEASTVNFTFKSETTFNVLRIVNITEGSEPKEIRNKEKIETTAFNTESSNLGETTVSDTNETLNIEKNTTTESKESIIVDLSTKILQRTTMQESTTRHLKESTTDPTKESTTDSIKETNTEPTNESATEPAKQTTKEPTIETITEPTNETTTETSKETTTDPIKEITTAEPTKEITTDPLTESTTESTKKSTIESTKESTTETTKETTTEITKKTTTEPTKQSTTAPIKETTTEQIRPKRKTTTEEPSAESYLPKWTKRTTRPTTTTKATTKRRTLGRPLVYMGGMEETNRWDNHRQGK